MIWYENLQNTLSQTNIDYEQVFYDSANALMNDYALVMEDHNGQTITYEFCELEYYFFDVQKHPDFYTHMHCLQLKCGKFYVHEKTFNRSGIDLTFGNGSYFGGILIRGLYTLNNNEKYICGPAKCAFKMKETILDSNAIDSLQEKINCVTIIERKDKSIDYNLRRSARVGIKKSLCNPSDLYLKKQYRFVRNDLYEAKNNTINGTLKDKMQLIICQ